MINRFISICFLAGIALSSVLFFGIALLIWIATLWFDKRLIILHMFTSFWASLYLWAMPVWSVSVKGRDKIRKGVNYIIVSNHQSQLDILVAFRLFFPFKWVSKAEVFRLPFIGWNMVLNRYIKVKRGNKASIQKMMDACEKSILQGNSLYFFPEGSRSRNGRLMSFKPGAFILSKKMKKPILPIIINGTKNALPKHSLNFHGRHHIEIKVLDEIAYSTIAELTVTQLAEAVRRQMADHILCAPRV